MLAVFRELSGSEGSTCGHWLCYSGQPPLVLPPHSRRLASSIPKWECANLFKVVLSHPT